MKKLLFFLTFLCASLLSLEAQTITWTGGGVGVQWHDPNNWDLLVVPSAANDVIIPDGSILTIDSDAIVKSIDVQGASTVNINAGIRFTDESTFDVNSIINWSLGSFWSGETGLNAHISTLTNKGTINILSLPTGLSYCILNNEGTINILAAGALWLYTRGELNNQESGIIDMQDECDILPMIPVPGYYTIGVLNNYGKIVRSIGMGYADIMVPTNNFGTIESMSGTLRFDLFELNNTVDGFIKGTATIELPATEDLINNGIFEPGASPGILTIIGNFTSTATSKLAVELNGLIQNTEYDLLAIQGNAVFDGIVDITMGFEGNVNDEFIVATTTGTITQCNLVPTATAVYDGDVYEFSVECRNDNEVVLTVTNVVVGPVIAWTGGGDAINWSDPYNWHLTIVPLAAHHVIIPDGSALTLNVDASIKSIEVRGASIFSITSDLTFTEKATSSVNSIVNWSTGFLKGGGILTNRGTLNIKSTGPKTLWSSIINNTGTVNMLSALLFIESGGVFNNQEAGIINLVENGGFSSGWTTSGTLNNFGILKRTSGVGVAIIDTETNNFGTIEAMSGILRFSNFDLNNTIDGIIKGAASIDIDNLLEFTNNGIFEPGASLGTLTVIGDFTSSTSSKLVVELNGLTQGTEYDLLAIQGNAAFDGVVDVTMGFEGNVNDEFIVATTTGTITQCTLELTATSIFDGKQYEFDVACRNDNEVVLTIVDKALGISTNELADAKILLFPNPTNDLITLRNDSGKNLQSATIIDLSGRIIKTVDLSGMGRDGIISLDKYASGYYFLKINSDNGSFVKRLIKQ